MVEEANSTTETTSRFQLTSEPPQPITSVPTADKERLSTRIPELDRVLGGGVVPGSLVLIGGEPGVGKSTLLLQASYNVARSGSMVLMVSGEESGKQLRLRADRLGAATPNLYVFLETNLEKVKEEVEKLKPSFLVIDSIQTVFHPDVPSTPGSVGQVRECTGELMRLSKSQGLPIFIVGHVTKEGSIAGPRILEHMVDTVLYFEGDGNKSHRIVRTVKNRYGSTNEIGVFEMTDAGLKEVANPSALFLAQRSEEACGSVTLATVEGSRVILVELQALVSPSYLNVPRRLSSGVDYNRLVLMVAVLERRVGLKLGQSDIYVSVAGGVKIVEPAADLAVALAIASARGDKLLPSDLVVFGEVGLTGEVRHVSYLDQRLKEAAKLGFKRAVIPPQEVKTKAGIKTDSVGSIKEAVQRLKL